mmetsp:Transcript_99583/g.277238  ORF Transcript_99583/g.277238 Transcript_99583/m.277238 type:complete len:220 (-) Transcript_99583:820-1479(-)
MRTVLKRTLSSVVPDAPIHVAHTTSAFFNSFHRPSRAYCFTSSRMLSGRPTRTTFRPFFPMPFTKLSTAVLLSAVTSIGRSTSSYLTRAETICTAVVVFPVPGGPWMSVMRCVQARVNACSWLAFSEARACASISSLKLFTRWSFWRSPPWSMGSKGTSAFPAFDSVVSTGTRINSRNCSAGCKELDCPSLSEDGFFSTIFKASNMRRVWSRLANLSNR